MSVKKRFFAFVLFFLILFLAWFLFACYRVLYAPMVLTSSTSITVYPGQTIHHLASALYQKRLISYPRIFAFLAYLKSRTRKIHFGRYVIHHRMNTFALLNNVMAGRGLVKYQLTLLEGWRFVKMMQAINTNPYLSHRLVGKKDKEIMMAMGHPAQYPEGLFLPETYTFVWGDSDIDILRQAYDWMNSYLLTQWKDRLSGLSYRRPYDALIVASLIEKETSIDEERPIIASVILNRLKKNMRLQVDPTVLYGLNKPYSADITRADLESKTPYNTYRIYGLPPTPINMPSRASIYAALHPAKTPYLYYVVEKNSRHIFSESYQQHLRAVKKYRIWQRQKAKNT